MAGSRRSVSTRGRPSAPTLSFTPSARGSAKLFPSFSQRRHACRSDTSATSRPRSATIVSHILICRASISRASPDGRRCRWTIAASACAVPSAHPPHQGRPWPPDRRAGTPAVRRPTPGRISPTPAAAPGRVASKLMSHRCSRTRTRATAGYRQTVSRARVALWRIAFRY